MDDSVLAFLGFVGIFVVLDVASLRFGVDSRRLTRELPLPGEPVVRISPDNGRHLCAPDARSSRGSHAACLASATPLPGADRPLHQFWERDGPLSFLRCRKVPDRGVIR
jgi:hypothetical protein